MSTAVKFSFEQYEMMVDAGIFAGKNQRRIELIRGELREMTPIGTRHATAVDRLTRWTTRFLDEDQVWLRIQGPVALPELESEPEPDVLLRVYHDAEQVEVIDLKQSSLPVHSLYEAPGLLNKWQVNLFVSKWLAFCVYQGHRFSPQSTVEDLATA